MYWNSVISMLTVLTSARYVCCDKFTCYSCSYNIEHVNETWSKLDCITSPNKPGVSTPVICKETFYCFIQESYNIRTNQIREFTRSCGAVKYNTGCTKDTYNIICRNSCQGTYCNKNDTTLHELYFNQGIMSYGSLNLIGSFVYILYVYLL